MTPLDFVDPPPAPTTFNVCLYGPTGSGKTTAAAKLTALGPVLWVNTEQPSALDFARKIAQDGLYEVRISRDTQDVRGVVGDVLRHVRDGADPQPATVVIDTIGKLRERLAKQIVVGPESKSRDQWGQVADVLKELLGRMIEAPLNFVVIAHESVEDADNDRIVRPLLGGAVGEMMPTDMDVVAYTGAVAGDDGDVRYVGQLVEARGRRCKDRSGGLGQFRDLDLAEWLGAYTRALAPDSDTPWAEGEPDAEVVPAVKEPAQDPTQGQLA